MNSLEKAGYMQVSRVVTIDEYGNPTEIIEVIIDGKRYGITVEELKDAVPGKSFRPDVQNSVKLETVSQHSDRNRVQIQIRQSIKFRIYRRNQIHRSTGFGIISAL